MQPLTLAEPSYSVICSDRIVAVHSMQPILFSYDFNGNLIEKKKINSQIFSPMEKVINADNPRQAMENYGKASWIVGMFCVDKDEILIQFFDFSRAADGNPISLMHVNRSAEIISEKSKTPQILFSEPKTDTLFLKDSSSDYLNHILKSVLIRK